MSSGSTATCYRKSLGTVNETEQVPMGDGINRFQQCCRKGDTLEGDHICFGDAPIKGGTGYYIAGCTDPSYAAPACRRSCENTSRLDIIYDRNLWHCCGGNDTFANCSSYTPFTFDAQSPDQLRVRPSTTVPITQRPSSTIPTNPTTTSSTTPTSPSSLSEGAIAGIVIGVLVLVGMLGTGAWFLFRQRRKRQAAEATLPMKLQNVDEITAGGAFHNQSQRSPPAMGYYTSDKDSFKGQRVVPRSELDASQHMMEIDSESPQELDADSPALELGAREALSSPVRDDGGLPIASGANSRELSQRGTPAQGSSPASPSNYGGSPARSSGDGGDTPLRNGSTRN